MSKDTRHKNGNWALPTTPDGRIEAWDYVKIALLMDIRDELQTLNRLLGCYNFTRLPHILDRIESNTKKRKYTRKAKP
jgi:hypothetical protein